MTRWVKSSQSCYQQVSLLEELWRWFWTIRFLVLTRREESSPGINNPSKQETFQILHTIFLWVQMLFGDGSGPDISLCAQRLICVVQVMWTVKRSRPSRTYKRNYKETKQDCFTYSSPWNLCPIICGCISSFCMKYLCFS